MPKEKTYKDGSFVGIEQAVCPVCGDVHTPDDAALFVHKRLRNVFPTGGKASPSRYALCAEHQRLYDEGYIAMVGIDPEKTSSSGEGETLKMEDAYRTGRVLHVKASAFERIFNQPAPSQPDGRHCPMAYVDDAVIQQLQESLGASEEQGD